MDIFKLAVTGSAGSGKSRVCQRLFSLGWPVFDCDRIAREVVEPGQPAYEKMVSLFGPECVAPDQTLDRAKIRAIIIESLEMRKKMEAIQHPAILDELFNRIEAAFCSGHRMAAAEVPLLFELSMEDRFDYNVTIAVDPSVMVDRIVRRDKVSEASARKMLSIQMDLEEKIRRSDRVLWNNRSEQELMASVDQLDGFLRKQFLTDPSK